MYQYIRIQYSTDSRNTVLDGFQEISNGTVIRNTDLDGNTVDFNSFDSCDSWVVDSVPPTPVWAPIPPDVVEEETPPVLSDPVGEEIP